MSVYFIEHNGLIKIGFTKYNQVENRLNQLRKYDPGEYNVLGFINGATQVEERQYHSMFSKSRVRGEWFLKDEAIIAEASKYPYNHLDTTDMQLRNALSLNITRYRKRINMTRDDLAEACKINPATLTSYESGDRDPGLCTIERLATVLGVEPWQMFIPGPQYPSDLKAWDSDELLEYIFDILRKYRKATHGGNKE